MASLVRPSLASQAPAAASRRILSTLAASPASRPAVVHQLRPAIHKSTRIAAFHATQRNQILPPLPQKVIGTANDPTPVPDPAPIHGSYHWSFERCVCPCSRRGTLVAQTMRAAAEKQTWGASGHH